MVTVFSILKQFQLLSRGVGLDLFLADIQLDLRKLFVGDSKASNLSVFWQAGLYTFKVYVGILTAGAMTHIYRELEHRESVADKLLAEVGSSLALFLGVGRQVEEHKKPHDAVFAETVHLTFLGKRPGGLRQRSNEPTRLLSGWQRPSAGYVVRRCALREWGW